MTELDFRHFRPPKTTISQPKGRMRLTPNPTPDPIGPSRRKAGGSIAPPATVELVGLDLSHRHRKILLRCERCAGLQLVAGLAQLPAFDQGLDSVFQGATGHP